jgi:hypothetical protein
VFKLLLPLFFFLLDSDLLLFHFLLQLFLLELVEALRVTMAEQRLVLVSWP